MGRRVKKAAFKFRPFSRKQKKILTWWMPNSPVHDMDGIIADGSNTFGQDSLYVALICYVGDGIV